VFDSFHSGIFFRMFMLATVSCGMHPGAACEAQQAQESHTVAGVVRNSMTGQPIARALVDGQADATLTDNQGRFELHLSQRFANLQVRRPGYTSRENGRMHAFNLEDAETTNLTLYLTPTATITGHVVAENGGDPNNVFFQVYRKRSVRGHERWIPMGGAETNSDGIFKMFDVEAPANYVLCSHSHREQAIVVAPGKTISGYGYPSQCYPSGMTGGADVLNLSAGQQAEVEIPLARQPFYQVTIAEPNYPLGGQNGVNVQIMQQDGLSANAPVQWNAQARTAEIYLPNGNYYAEGRSGGQTKAYGRVDFKVADMPLQSLRLVVLPLVPVPVEFHKEFANEADAKSKAGAVSFSVIQGNGMNRHADIGLQLELMPLDRITETALGIGLHYPDGVEDGDQLELDGVTPGRYWVLASYFRPGYISAITSAGVDLTKDPLVVGAGNNVAPIQVTVRNDGGHIDCTVNSPSPPHRIGGYSIGASGVVVYAIPAGPRVSPIPQAGVAMDGRTQIANLAPGTYRVIALEAYRDLDSMDTNDLSQLAEKGKTVTVAAGETVSVQVDVTRSEEQNP